MSVTESSTFKDVVPVDTIFSEKERIRGYFLLSRDVDKVAVAAVLNWEEGVNCFKFGYADVERLKVWMEKLARSRGFRAIEGDLARTDDFLISLGRNGSVRGWMSVDRETETVIKDVYFARFLLTQCHLVNLPVNSIILKNSIDERPTSFTIGNLHHQRPRERERVGLLKERTDYD